MAGYDWTMGKSNNAVSAEMDGRYPLSKITKADLEEWEIDISLKDAKLLAKYGYWEPCEWHHTGKYFNETDYYDLDSLKFIIEDDENYPIYLEEARNKNKQEAQDKEQDIFYAKIAVTEYERRRGRWIADEFVVYAEVRGWENHNSLFCTYNGNRKKKSNINIISKITKSEFDKIKKKERIDNLRSKKKSVIEKYSYLINSDNEKLSTLFKKVKNAKKIEAVDKIEKEIRDLYI